MRRFARLFSPFALAAGLAAAQDAPAPAAELPALNSLRTPTSPAFTLLGIEPTSVERPNTPSDLAVSLLESTNGLSGLPENYALEFSPYWLSQHRSLTWEADQRRSVGESLKRTFTVSLATAQTGDENAPVTSLAVGVRASLFSGHVPTTVETRLTALRETIARQAALLQSQLQATALARLEAEQSRQGMAIAERLGGREIDEAEAERQFAQVRAAGQAERERVVGEAVESAAYRKSELVAQARKAVDELGSTREGFFWELAGGASWDFADADWSQRQAKSLGAWTTASYAGAAWSVVGVARYLEDRQEHTHSFDLGARAIYARDAYAVSLEYLRRTASGSESGQRLVGVAEYRLADKAWLVASFGRDQASKSSLVAKLGLTFNLAKQRFQDLKS